MVDVAKIAFGLDAQKEAAPGAIQSFLLQTQPESASFAPKNPPAYGLTSNFCAKAPVDNSTTAAAANPICKTYLICPPCGF